MSRSDPFLVTGEGNVVPTRFPAWKNTTPVRGDDMGGTIYGLTCRCHPEEGIQYVGQTKRRDPLVRFHERLRVAEAETRRWQSVYLWIPRHGVENIKFHVIENSIPIDQLNYRELCHIRGLRGAGNKMMNQDDFWWSDERACQHTWPDWEPFANDGCVSYAFTVIEFERGIYPLTFREFKALFPGLERQTVEGLAELVTPAGRAMALKWREGGSSIQRLESEERLSGPESYGVTAQWARDVRRRRVFPHPPPRERYESPWATY